MKDIEQMNHRNVTGYYNSAISKVYRNFDYFKTRENKISKLLQESIGKSVLDVGAGDCFWLKHFVDKVDFYSVVEIGYENCLLIEENFSSCKEKLHIINADAFQFDYVNINADNLLFSFFMSHFDFSSIIKLIQKISQNVDFDKILILDSFWSDYRKNRFINNELKLQKRIINESGDIVEIPKRFLSFENLQELSSAMKMKLEIKYLDEYWCFVTLTKQE
jgi:hypothetical protein